ncbi:sensor histidine kinase [Streptomyces reniochalinae]|uniref:sensor histidine kinase n=1 Tax=Streptomyces reniochalinae TaxID=2250578 RepID=UPI001FE97528|nr:histidine kinase [Streptomyces reniochalinae]
MNAASTRTGPGRFTAALRRPRSRALLADLALWLFLAYPLPTLSEVPVWLRVAAAPLLAAAAFLSRRAPVAAAAVPAGLGLAVTPELFTSTFSPALVILSFLLGRRAENGRRSLAAAVAVCAVGLVLALTLPDASLWDWFTLIITVLFAAVFPWLLGRFRRRQYDLQATGWDLAARMEREHELVADRARLRERSRIAGDMHDSLGHDLSLIAVRAAALQVSPGVDDAARASAAELRQAAADATERLRQIIGLLRQDTTAPTAETVHDLVARTAASGVAITLREDAGNTGTAGSPKSDAEDAPVLLPPLVDRAVHRVVQEAVTNATKHAPGAAITVQLRKKRTAVHVTVTNDAPAADGRLRPGAHAGKMTGTGMGTGAGTGLISLDERVRQAGGTFRAHPLPSADGFEVTAQLPLGPDHLPNAPARPETDAAPLATRSGAQLARARRRVRRGMANALWIPAAATAVLAVVMYGYQLYTSYESVLSDHTYSELRVGDPRSSVLPRLPSYEFDAEAAPPGAPQNPVHTDECRFHRVSTFDNSLLYRLCFTDGRLSHKDLIRADERDR